MPARKRPRRSSGRLGRELLPRRGEEPQLRTDPGYLSSLFVSFFRSREGSNCLFAGMIAERTHPRARERPTRTEEARMRSGTVADAPVARPLSDQSLPTGV